ncbi:Peptidase family C25 [uncultured archaeon]|nr:Peptidase family C25 [uncultured archaeon]
MITPSLADQIKIVSDAQKALLAEAGLSRQVPDSSKFDKSWLQVANPDTPDNASYFCPVNPEVRDHLYNQIETLINDYKADGIVLYKFGFQSESFCFCDVCKEKFYQDTGIDLSKVSLNSYNQERWNQWKQDQLMQIVLEARNITSDLGPAKIGVALDNPFDRKQGYNFAEMIKVVDFAIISPLSAQDVQLACSQSDRPVYVRLSDDYVGYVLSTQNVEGAVKYIEEIIQAKARGMAFEYNVVHTPIWSELEGPTPAARWLLQQIGNRTLGIGNVSWKSSSVLAANNSYDLAGKISLRWKRSPGVVIVGENYSAALQAAPIASYLNWPVLFVDSTVPKETKAAIERLDPKDALIVGPISESARQNLSQMNLTLMKGDSQFLVGQMEKRGESPSMVVFANSHDLSLLPPAANSVVKRTLLDDLLVRTEISPSEIPAEEMGEIVRLNFTMSNTGNEVMKGVRLVDVFPMGRLIKWPRPSSGLVNITDPYTGLPSNADSAFINGSLLRWSVNKLDPGKSVSLNAEVEILFPMDSGWKKGLDTGATAAYDGFTYNHTLENRDDWPVINLTYPIWIYSGRTNISWNLDREASYTALNLYSPDGRIGKVKITDTAPGKLYELKVQLLTPGKWKFNIEAGDGYTFKTDNRTIIVRSDTDAVNITSFSHTKVPRLSLVAAAAASARRAMLIDVAKDPQKLDPLNEEAALQQKVDDLGLSPEYLMVVGDTGSMPFISTGLIQKLTPIMEYEIFRDYQLPMQENNYSSVAVGRITGLSVYDASQLLARTLAYDRLGGAWRDNALVISSPPLSYPQAPTAMSIRDYLLDAGLNVKDLRYEEATYQQAVSQMNNGKSIVHFDHHGNEEAWQLSDWSMMDSSLTGQHVKEMILPPQTTTASACVTVNLKGYYLNVSGTRMYIPRDMDDSIALAFIRAGAVNYIGESALSWIFVSDDYFKRFYQALVYENSSVGQAQLEADNLFKLKFRGAENLKAISEYDEALPDWQESVQGMLNQTAYMDVILGDPSFRPGLPLSPSLPYSTRVSFGNATATGENKTDLTASITPNNESATDWVYWIQSDSSSGELNLNAPPAIIGEVWLPKDADKIVVKENGLAVWHDEYNSGEKKRVMWPIIQPKMGEKRDFQVEYVLIPGQVQIINVTSGWNAVAIYLNPKDASASKYLKNKPYRGIFSITGKEWNFGMKDSGMLNVTRLEIGNGYLIDAADNFSMQIPGKPVDLPYRLNLHQGWNMIGLPVNRTVDVNNITVNAEHKRYSYPQAVKKGLVSAFIWKYEDQGWTHLGENETLVPGEAYLFESMTDAKLEFR